MKATEYAWRFQRRGSQRNHIYQVLRPVLMPGTIPANSLTLLSALRLSPGHTACSGQERVSSLHLPSYWELTLEWNSPVCGLHSFQSWAWCVFNIQQKQGLTPSFVQATTSDKIRLTDILSIMKLKWEFKNSFLLEGYFRIKQAPDFRNWHWKSQVWYQI